MRLRFYSGVVMAVLAATIPETTNGARLATFEEEKAMALNQLLSDYLIGYAQTEANLSISAPTNAPTNAPAPVPTNTDT